MVQVGYDKAYCPLNIVRYFRVWNSIIIKSMVVVDKNILNISSKILFSTRGPLASQAKRTFSRKKIDKIRLMISPEEGAKGRWIRHWIILFKLISIYGPNQYNEILKK